MVASSYNELFGLGSFSEPATLEQHLLLSDDAASTVIDDLSSNSRDGTLTNNGNTSVATDTGPNSYLTKAIRLDGTNDHVAITDDLIAIPGTTMFWVQIDTFGSADSQPTLMRSGGHYVGVNGTTKRLEFFNGSWRVAGSGTVTTSWHHVAIVAESGTTKLYLDGVLVLTHAGSITVTGTSIELGARTDAIFSPNSLDGLLSDLAIFSEEKTVAEILLAVNGPELVNTVAPVLSGTETIGSTLSCTTGTWALDSPFALGTNGTAVYSYQWTRSDDAIGTGEVNISGATASTHLLVSADSGKFIRCSVRATNDGGFDSAADTDSNMSGSITSLYGKWPAGDSYTPGFKVGQVIP